MDDHDPTHEFTPRTVTVCDLVTGESRTTTVSASAWDWWCGNWSCDCNRRDRFFPEHERAAGGHCIGAARYVVTVMDPMPDGFEVAEMNEDYPAEVAHTA